MTVWYTSDPHVSHRTVAEMRGQALGCSGSVEWHDAMLATQWDHRVKTDDVVWVLGDLSLQGTGAVTRALEWVSERPGRKHLISGNHDPAHPGVCRQYARWLPKYLEVFESVQPFARRKFNIKGLPSATTVLLSHFPYSGGGDHTGEERYTQWRLPDLGDWLLHGHTHSTERVNGRMIHVGVDANGFAPVAQETIEEIIANER